MWRIVTTGALVLTVASSALADGKYVEVWNPPEARATAPHRVSAAHKLAVHRHIVPHAVKVHARRALRFAPKLMAKQGHMQHAVPADTPGMSETPRQMTPEGNVLRVTARGTAGEVTR